MSDIWTKPKVRYGMLVSAFLVGCALTGSLLTRPSLAVEQEQEARISHAALTQRTAGLASLEDGFVAIGERVQPAVVSIRASKTVNVGQTAPDLGELFRGFGFDAPNGLQIPRRFRTQGGGSGLIVRSDGWILTNDHVVGGADKVTVKLEDGREYDGTVRRDFRSDLAVVKIKATGLPAIDFADSSKVRVGQWAVAFGAPLSLEDAMTLGIISARKRQQAIGSGDEGRFYPELLQTDASINPGNSGGPLVNIEGRVIGINVAIASPTGGSVGIGFAIPSNTARKVMDDLISSGKVVRGFLGIMPANLEPAQRDKYGVAKGGVLVQGVSEGTPAARAGLQVEDVITRVNGAAVEDDADFRNRIASAGPGDTVTMTIKRDRKETTVKATLEAAPDPTAPAVPAQRTGVEKLGLKVEAISAELSKRFNLGSLKEGAVVVGVEPGSPSDEAGLRTGDVILRINGEAITGSESVSRIVGRVKSGDGLAMVVRRDKQRMLVTVEVP